MNFALFLFLALISCRAHLPLNTSDPKKYIHVEGHRGARAVLPENSLEAFDYALKVGVDVLEMDMAVTSDLQVVIAHDPYVSPELCTQANGSRITKKLLIKDLNLKEVQSFVCGLHAHPRFPRQKPKATRIPTLAEVFRMVKNSKYPAAKNVKFNLETKVFAEHPDATHSVNVFVDAILGEIKKSGFQGRTFVQSFDFRTLKRIRELKANLPLIALTESDADPLKTLGDLKVEVLSPHFKQLTFKNVKEAQARGMKVVPWTVNDVADWDDMIALRVDGIISDDPEPLLQHLKEKGFH